jgi:2-dehydropantoate 2-reductase
MKLINYKIILLKTNWHTDKIDESLTIIINLSILSKLFETNFSWKGEKMRNISLIGLGGIGCAYASKLYDMDPQCIKVIADEERIKRYNENGIIINGKRYDFNYVPPKEKVTYADLILICVKYNQLSQAIEDIKNHVGPDTIILSLLNGISSEEIIGEVYGMDKLLYGTCVGIDAVREGNSIRFSSPGIINFGEKTNTTYSEKVKFVKEIFDNAGIKYNIPEDMMHTLWWKYMVNVGINQASAVLKAPYGVFQNVKEAQNLMEAAMHEVIDLSKINGTSLNEDDIKAWYKVLNSLDAKNKTSMLQDIEAGRKTEVEMFSGTVCKLGEKYGIETPVNRTLFSIIRVMEQM